MTDRLMISGAGPVEADVTVPGSKSLTNRALLAAALAEGNSILTGALESEDTQIMAEALARIGFGLTSSTFSERIVVHGGLSRRTVANVDRTPRGSRVGNSESRKIPDCRPLVPFPAYGNFTVKRMSPARSGICFSRSEVWAEIDTLGAPNSFPCMRQTSLRREVSVRGYLNQF